jgi:Mn2+/Fe2+ NRAMP family transporter
VKRFFEIALGIVTSVGGFLEAGSVATSAQAGSQFGYQLIWAIALGTLCLIFLIEMSGRFTAVSGHTIPDALRERFGYPFFTLPLVTVLIVTVLVLISELAGVCQALQMATGIGRQWWALPVVLLSWLVLWLGTFGVVEKGVSLLGLVTVSFLVGAIRLHPEWGDVLKSALPSRPSHDGARYWFLAVSIVGATISPYLLFFYSSGAKEEGWDESYLTANRFVAVLGMMFGGVLSAAVLVVSAVVFLPRGIQVDRYEQVALLLTTVLGRWGFVLFIASLAIACLGATLEITLSVAYLIAQGFGWNWSENAQPRTAARFALAYTVVLLVSVLPVLLGVDPLKITILSMAFTAMMLPVSIFPFLILMNDRAYLGKFTNGHIGNAIVMAIIALACVLAVVTIPLEIFGS